MLIERVVVNASPLITLFKGKLADLLPQLFSEVQIPLAVWQEVTATKDDIAAQTLPSVSWVQKTEAVVINPAIAAWDLGAGESEVLSYALLHPEYTAMIDDAAARRCAISLNISTLGTGGAIVLAKRRGVISSVIEPIQALRTAGLWLSEELVQLLKQQAGE
jgi:predicted nucleic acid-binding protein